MRFGCWNGVQAEQRQPSPLAALIEQIKSSLLETLLGNLLERLLENLLESPISELSISSYAR